MTHTLKTFNEATPMTKRQREIDAMKNGEYKVFNKKWKMDSFACSIWHMRRKYKRRFFGVKRQVNNKYYVWLLRY